ncbi:Ribokinase-like protein [Cladochytrium replicatum]|nr:Ribokinase-like protein [Cladochytrium replicatum]
MLQRVVCFGSINRDEVFRVPDIARPGETLASTTYKIFPGGKGANQSVALAKALSTADNAQVHHVGRVGPDGVWIRDMLKSRGVHTESITVDPDAHTGRAVIQVSDATHDNAIVLFPGANREISPRSAIESLETIVPALGPDDWIVLQNEVSSGPDVIHWASERGMTVVFNPAPCDNTTSSTYPLTKTHHLILNTTESQTLFTSLHNQPPPLDPSALAAALLPHTRTSLVLTLGSQGVMIATESGVVSVKALEGVKVVDTTGAGDVFVGFYVGALVRGWDVGRAAGAAVVAAGIACESEGAVEGCPSWDEVVRRMV